METGCGKLLVMRDALYNQKSLLFRFRMKTERRDFFKKNDRVLIACSGGADSAALFHLVHLSFPDLKISIVHFNHGLRPRTAKRDELFVKKLAETFKVPFFVGRAKLIKKLERIKLSIEEAARQRRYAFFQTIYKKTKSKAILFAHHLDDQAETILMRVCQGTGLRGLLGIREQMTMEGMRVIRPLLAFSKAELLDFMREQNFKFCEDETNHKPDFLRNRLRLEVLPHLAKKVNPRILQALARIPEIIRDENDLIEQLEEAAEKKLLIRKTHGQITLNLRVFRQVPIALQFRILDRLIKQVDPSSGLLFEHVAGIQRNLKKNIFTMDLPRSVKLEAQKGKLIIFKE